jgi:molecular chaperone GrpE
MNKPNPETVINDEAEIFEAPHAGEPEQSGDRPHGQRQHPRPSDSPSEADVWKDKAYRHAADLENYRKRAATDVENAKLYASQSFARDMLTVADNLTRALQAAEGSEANKAVLEGVQMVAANLEQTLKRHGVQRIVVKPGDALNPDLHQVMNEVASDVTPGHIVHELQPGYTLNGRLLRPAFVSVANKNSEK